MLVSTLQIFDQRVNLSLLLIILKSLNRNDVPMIRLLNFSRIKIQKISSKLQLSFSISKKTKNIASRCLLRKNIPLCVVYFVKIPLRVVYFVKNLTSLNDLSQKSDFFFYYNLIILDSSKPQSEQKFHQYSACHQS